MSRRIGWMAGIGGVGMVAAWALLATAAAAEPAAAPASEAKPAGTEKKEKVIFTFDDQAKLDTFTGLWDRRRAVILRMTVLQSYWNEEQATLAQLNTKLETDYKMDFNKDYYLDRERRVIIEREAPPAPIPTPPAEAPKP